MNKEEERLISYNYNEFGQEFGDLIVDIRNERDKYKIVIDKIKEYISKTTYKEVFKDDEHSIKEFWFIKDILELLEEIE